jgi:antitoxin CptB
MTDNKLLRWRCRRGMQELDKLLEHYLEHLYQDAQQAQQQAFETLLSLPDPELFDYLLAERTPADADLKILVSRIIHLKKTLQ